jgi:hypothetical protein
MKKNFLIIFSSLVIASLFFSFKPAYAAGVGLDKNLLPVGAPTVAVGTPESMAVSLTQRIINVLFSIAGVVAIFFIVQNGFFLAMSGGSEEVVTQHKKGIMWAIIGLILVILSYSIVRFVISIPLSSDEQFNPAPPVAETVTPTEEATPQEATPPPVNEGGLGGCMWSSDDEDDDNMITN